MKLRELLKPVKFLIIMTVICGLLYTAFITVSAQLIFPKQSNGSIIEVDGKKYSELLGQQFSSETHMWGRIMKLDVTTFKDINGKPLMYAMPSNLSPASEEYDKLIKERVDMIKYNHPTMNDTKIPVDLVTCSGSGLDPHISPVAAEYQVDRLASANNMSKDAVRMIIQKCTDEKLFGILGESTVNVLKVNLMLDKSKNESSN